MMKTSSAVLFLLLAAPLLAIANPAIEDAAVNGTTIPAAVTKAPAESSNGAGVGVVTSSVEGTAAAAAAVKEIEKEEIKHGNANANDAQQPKLDPASLHRVPVYEDRHPAVETISMLGSRFKSADGGSSKKNAAEPKIELPIPSRCPAITGTEVEEVGDSAGSTMLPLLGADTSARAAQRGCRFFIMTELMDRSTAEYQHASAAQQLNRTLEGCFTSCNHAYDNGTTAAAACLDGCRKTALVTEVAKKSASVSEIPEEDGATADDEVGHRSFSIIVPLIGRDPSDQQQAAGEQDPFQSGMPRALQTMMAMMHSLAERARQSMTSAQRGDDDGGLMALEPKAAGGSISVSRSMSVVMTRDKDGHQKVVVVHQLPRISIHRDSSFGGMDDQEDDAVRRFEEMITGNGQASEEASAQDDLRARYFGHLANGAAHRTPGTSNYMLKSSDSTLDDDVNSSESTRAYYYRARICYLLPRLFYVTLAVLSLYLIFWLCCIASASIAKQNFIRSQAAFDAVCARTGVGAAGGNGVAIMTEGRLKKIFLSKNARYYKLNNKATRSNSTTSLPPPYPGQQVVAGESCAEPLPEKTPIPKGGGIEASGSA